MSRGILQAPAVVRQQELQELLGTQATLADFLGAVWTLRYTGTVVLHLHNGQPQTVELGLPTVIKLQTET